MLYKKLPRSEGQQTRVIIKILAVFWFVTKLWSYKTWIAERTYPVIPSMEILADVPHSLHLCLFIFSLLILVLIIFIRPARIGLIMLFLSEICSCLLDTVRWQPWEYMYLCMLLVIIINFHKPRNILLLIHLFLVSVYLFSGLHKLSRDFLTTVWMNMVLIDFLGFSSETIIKYKLFFLGLSIPVFEIMLALLLLFSKSKRKISCLLICIHISILIVIGPFGLNYNSVVWFWNVSLILILMVVYHQSFVPADKKFYFQNSYWLILWFLLPVFSFFGHWYQYFSSNLYSGKGNQLYICISEEEKSLKPFSTRRDMCRGGQYINLQDWALSEIKSAPIPEPEIYIKIGIYLKKKYRNSNIKIMLYDKEKNKTVEL